MSALMIMSCALSPLQDSTAKAAKKPKLNKTKVELKVGEKVKLRLSNAKNVKWSSNKKKVATVSKKGVVTAKKNRKAVISAKHKKKTYKCKVTVKDKMKNVVPTSEIPQSTVVPTAEPIVEPTANPTDVIKAAYTELEDRLTKSGDYTVNESIYSYPVMFKVEESTVKASVSKNKTLNTTIFSITFLNKESQTVIIDIEVTNPELRKGTIRCNYCSSDDEIELTGSGEIELASIVSGNTQVIYSSYNFTEPLYEQVLKLVTPSVLDLGMITWKEIIKGLGCQSTMNSLGFTAYQYKE